MTRWWQRVSIGVVVMVVVARWCSRGHFLVGARVRARACRPSGRPTRSVGVDQHARRDGTERLALLCRRGRAAQPMCTTSRVDGARKSSACQSVRLIEQAESDEASETASGAGARPAKRGGGAAQASARAKACMLASNKSRCCNKFGGPSSGPLSYLHCSVQGTQICKITCRLCKLWPNRLVIRRHQNSITVSG